MTTIRRLYFYVVAFAALMVTTLGTITLLAAVLDLPFRSIVVAGDPTSQIALALAMLIIGGPVWLLHWFVAEHSATRNADDRRAVPRHLYLNLVLGTAFVNLVFSGQSVLAWLLGTRLPYDPVIPNLAALLAWGVVWAYHWWTLRREGVEATRRTLHRWYLYGAAVFSLAWLVVGVYGVLNLVLQQIYNALFSRVLTTAPLWSDALVGSLTWAVVGGVAWAFHWLYAARGDTASVLRQVYLYLVAVFGGLAAVLIVVGTVIYQTLQYAFDPGAFTASAHFSFLPLLLPAGLVGLLVGLYHWRALQREAAGADAGGRTVRRAYRYLTTAFGLGALSGGLGVLLALLIGLATGPASLTARWWRDPLSLAFALLLVGGPLWAYEWFRAEAEARSGDPDERRALPRRLLVYGALTLAILGLLGNLVYALFRLLEAVLQGRLSLPLFFELRGNLAVAVVAGAVLAYYGLVLRSDLRHGAETARRRKSVLLWVGAEHRDLVPSLQAALPGSRVQVVEGPPEGVPPAVDVGQAAEALAHLGDLPGEHALVVVSGGSIRVYPYH